MLVILNIVRDILFFFSRRIFFVIDWVLILGFGYSVIKFFGWFKLMLFREFCIFRVLEMVLFSRLLSLDLMVF